MLALPYKTAAFSTGAPKLNVALHCAEVKSQLLPLPTVFVANATLPEIVTKALVAVALGVTPPPPGAPPVTVTKS